MCASPCPLQQTRSRAAAVVLLVVGTALTAGLIHAQPVDTTQVDTVQVGRARVDTVRGLAIGYQDLLREYRAYRLAPNGAAVPDTVQGRRPPGLEIDGLVVDETQTKIGRDFYEVFYSRWAAPPNAVNFTVTIKEQILPNRGTRIVVQINDAVAFQAYLQPRYDAIEEAALRGVVFARRALRDQAPFRLGY
ncbi:MAG: CsgE family curli-type amyloid fiber assembly protein [Bacteroidota bacterium]